MGKTILLSHVTYQRLKRYAIGNFIGTAEPHSDDFFLVPVDDEVYQKLNTMRTSKMDTHEDMILRAMNDWDKKEKA